MSIKIAHLSDTHLGFSDFEKINEKGINNREADFYSSYIKCIDAIIKSNPDVIVHTGDFFHRPSPSNRALIEGLSQLKKVSKKKIPFIIISGNHSTPKSIYTSPIIKAMENIEGIYPVFSQKYEAIELNDTCFHCLPHINDDSLFEEEAKKIFPQKGRYNVLLLHSSIGKDYLMQTYGERIYPPDRMSLFEEFDYVAAGHWHSFNKIKNNCYYSGSTERLSDREAGTDKGFILAEIETNKLNIEFNKIETRNWLRFEIKNCKDKSLMEITNELDSLKSTFDTNSSIISIYLNSLRPDQAVDLSLSKMKEIFSDAFNIIIKRYFHKEGSKALEYSDRFESLESVFSEYVKKNISDPSEFNLIINESKKYFS